MGRTIGELIAFCQIAALDLVGRKVTNEGDKAGVFNLEKDEHRTSNVQSRQGVKKANINFRHFRHFSSL